jgi:alkylation response protein AidB-like acyl-CoA dehydrogenase
LRIWAGNKASDDMRNGMSSADARRDIATMPRSNAALVTMIVNTAQQTLCPDTQGRDGPAQRRLLDDASVAYRLGRAFARIEAAHSAPGIFFGRVAVAQTMRDVAPEFMEVLGPASALGADTRGAVVGGVAEYLCRSAPLIGIYGGTIDVFRNMIAQHVLGLGRPNYSPPKQTR